MPLWRKLLKRFRFELFVVVASILVVEASHRTAVLATVEYLYSDLWHRLSGVRYTPAHAALVVVDDATLAEHGDTPMVFWTPLFARAAATLRAVGATVIGVDFLFAITPEDWIGKLGLSAVEGLRDYDLSFRQELNTGRVVVAGAIVRGANGAQDDLLLPHTDYLLALPAADLVSHIGLADLDTDNDGGVRNYLVTPPMTLPADVAEGAPRFTLGSLLSARAARLDKNAKTWRVGGRRIGVTDLNAISYTGPPGSVPRVSLSKVLAEGAATDPAVQALRGKVVIIGADYQGMNDIHTTPYSGPLSSGGDGLMAGVEVQANIVETLLSGKDTKQVPGLIRLIIAALFIGLTSWAYRRRTPWTGLLQLVVVLAVSLVIGFAMFQRFWLMPAAALQAGLLTTYLLTFSGRLTSEERERARIKKMFKGYVSDSVVEMLLSSDKKLDLGGQGMHITVLFSDIRAFTTITEKLAPYETVEFLNEYFGRVVIVILEEGGRVDKFIGDAIMAEFGVPYAFPDHAYRALRAAVRIRQVAQEFDEWMQTRFPGRGIPTFQIGIGVHTGNVVVGNIGAETRMEYTAIGDTVNVASRLEGETKHLKSGIAASAETLEAAGDRILTGSHESISVKGRLEPVDVYEIIDVRQ